MSIQAMAWALDQDLPARPKLVLVSIANHANHVDGYCWLKVETIAAEASCSPRAVHNFVGALIRNGFVRKEQRRGDDGRQRANDYWILLDRDPSRKWVKIDDGDVDEPETEPVVDDAAPQDVAEPTASGAVGENDLPSAPTAVDTPAGAVGPTAPACSHIESAEPSKIKPEEDARAKQYRPRAYRPPPPPAPQPLGEVTGKAASEPIFVFYPSRAYDAWAIEMGKRSRITSWRLLTTRVVDGQRRSGWYFPTLFPPSHADPPLASDDAA